jgi:hypothetical protein
VAPAATVTLAGTVTLALLLDRVTTEPPASAAELMMTVQAADPGAVTLDGLHETAESDGCTAAPKLMAAEFAPLTVTPCDVGVNT